MPSGERCRVSYTVSDSMSCIRRARVPVRAPNSPCGVHERMASVIAALFSRSRPPPPAGLHTTTPSVGQTSGATPRCLNPGFSERIGNSRRTGSSCNNASNEGLIVGRPVRNAVLRLIRGMDLRLHPCRVAPAEGHEKCGPSPTRAGYPSRIRCQAATGSWTKSRQWETQRTLFSSARATMWPPAKVDGVWPFNDAWLRTSLSEARRHATLPRSWIQRENWEFETHREPAAVETRAEPISLCRKRPFATHRRGRRPASAAVCRIPCLILSCIRRANAHGSENRADTPGRGRPCFPFRNARRS